MAKKSSRRARLVSGSTANRRTRLKRKLRRSEDARPLVCGSLIVQNWDKNLSLADNYKRLGLCQDPNKDSLLNIARNQKKKLARSADDDDDESMSKESGSDQEETEVNPIRAKLQEMAANPPRLAVTMPRSMPIQEQAIMSALVKKYGDDVEAMARDIKLNKFQKTSVQLQSRLQIYQQLQSL